MNGPLAREICPITPALLASIEARGFGAEQFLHLKLGVGEAVGHPNQLAVPYIDGADIVGVAVLQAQPGEGSFTKLRQLGADGVLYNINALRDADLADEPLIVTEGEANCWAALASGFRRVVGVPVARADGRRVPCLEETEELWRDVRQFILCTYDDDAGAILRENIATVFGRARCKWVQYPRDCSTLLDALRRFGVRGVEATIERAQWYAAPDIYSMSELPEPPLNPAFDTGMVGLSEHFRMRRGDLTVVSGVPGAGKTSFVNELTSRMALKHGWRSVFASFEQRSKPDHRRALRTFHGQKLEKMLGPRELADADDWIERHFRFLVPTDDTETSLEWLMERMSTAVSRFDPHIMVIDPWNELEHVRPRDMTQTEYTGWAIRSLKRFARCNQLHIIVVAHPAKLQRTREGKYPQPTLYDIADSAHWANKPDAGILIWREGPEPNLPTRIIVAKSRYHSEIGRPGAIEGIWNEQTGRYTITDDGGMHGQI